ncbi:glycosyltransferase [Treponema sp. Marseille-Q4132]|uniref:glycosyltransferase n=1 Tax=Treponema sp. Marseille-Q4132 TaxID=2766701 RepID=UPI002111340C|nr:glycosyltransferase [Treponema sp. Marseille-Q4132]
MRIAFLTFSLQGGGAERMVSRLANAFVRHGIQVDLLLFNTENPSYTVNPSVQIIDIGKKSKFAIKRTLGNIKAIRSYMRAYRPDVMFCFIVTMIPFAVLGRIGSKTHCKIIGAERANPHALAKNRRFAVNRFLRFCDGFVFQTAGAQSCYPKYTQKRGIVIGNIAPRIEVQRTDSNVIKNAICSVGRLHPHKDYETLIKAFSIVLQYEPDATLHIYGQGISKQNLEKQAQELGVFKSIVFEGFSKTIDVELQKYEIFVFSSKAEGMPNALIEAMACGCACVSSDCDFGPRELIKDGENGFLVPVADSKTLADKLLYLLRNSSLRKKFSREAIKIQETYSEEKIVTLYLDYAREISDSK